MGNTWLPVEARQDRIVCNIGDQLMRVSCFSIVSGFFDCMLELIEVER